MRELKISEILSVVGAGSELEGPPPCDCSTPTPEPVRAKNNNGYGNGAEAGPPPAIRGPTTRSFSATIWGRAASANKSFSRPPLSSGGLRSAGSALPTNAGAPCRGLPAARAHRSLGGKVVGKRSRQQPQAG